MKWLHLSDIHFANFDFSSDMLKNSLLKKLEELSLNLDFILITGDFFYQNKTSKEIIPKLRKYINSIGKVCNVRSKRIYMCQGNHDVNRSDNIRNSIIDKVRKQGQLTNGDYESLCKQVNENYQSLYREIKRTEYNDYEVFEDKNHNARIISINSCLLSKDESDYQNLSVCAPILEKIKEGINDDKLNIVIMHHGVDWLNPSDRKQFEHWLDDNKIDLLFVGHTHQPNVVTLNDVNRDIFQFTSGAIMTDKYSVPSFYICDEDKGTLTMTLFSYSDKTDSWEVDNHSLRKFKNDGKRAFYLQRRSEKTVPNRIDLNNLTCEALIQQLNNKYEEHYKIKRFFSDKSGEYEDFNAWKIVSSLSNIGIPYPIALRLTVNVVNQITSDDYLPNDLISSSRIKMIVYDSILLYHDNNPEINELDLGIWANKYSKQYNKNDGFKMIQNGNSEPISYSLLKNSIIKEVIVGITGNEVFFNKITTSELEKMSFEIMRFIKSLCIFKIRKEVLLNIITEYVTEPPHQWFVNNNREEIYNSHKKDVDRCTNELSRKSTANPLIQIDIAYHLFSAYLSIYDDYIGCTEISPIIILKNSIYQIGAKRNKSIPMRKCMLIQLREDLKNNNVQFEHFRSQVFTVYRNIVERKDVTNNDTVKALLELRRILSIVENKSGEKWVNTGNAFNDVYSIFKNALGFIVRSPIQVFNHKAFVVAPYWDEYQASRYNLGDDMLVCVFEDNSTIEDICNYLKTRGKNVIQELVLFKLDVSSFLPEERRHIREELKKHLINVRCVFIQEANFTNINKEGWRKVFFRVVEASKKSIW